MGHPATPDAVGLSAPLSVQAATRSSAATVVPRVRREIFMRTFYANVLSRLVGDRLRLFKVNGA